MFAFPLGGFAETWIERSDQVAKEYSLDDADRYPEGASSLGYREYDSKATQLEDDMETRDVASLEKWRAKLKKAIEAASDPNFKMDLNVLLESVEHGLEGKRLAEKYGDIPFYSASKTVFNSLRELINPQSGEDRKKAAVDRFKTYVNGHGNFKPLLEAYQSRVLYKESKHPKKQLQSLRQEVEQYLEESPDYVKGIQSLLEQSGRKDWSSDFEKFKGQVGRYDAFVRSHVLPKARTDYRLPAEFYAYILKVRGIKATPDELIRLSLADYKTTYDRFKTVAKEVAKKHKLKESNPASVINFLKSKQVTKTDEVKQLYQNADTFLAKLIQKQGLVSLPKEPLKIRFADEAESKANPVPHLVPPPLVGNRGERPEFVVPTAGSGKLPFDDFSYEAAALILTAHEGRPGHDLQFSTMLDNGVSVIRARYAANNVNVEGWGLYAEDLVFHYLPLESQLAALQTRLWRIARGFLDPQIQLGKIEPKKVIQVFTKELGVSDVMAGLEVRRYTYEDPGQAPSYYYGLKRIQVAKAALQKKLGASFTDKCFNDALLSMGLLPIDLIAARLVESLQCPASTDLTNAGVL